VEARQRGAVHPSPSPATVCRSPYALLCAVQLLPSTGPETVPGRLPRVVCHRLSRSNSCSGARQAWSRALPRFLLSGTDMWIDMLRGNGGREGRMARAAVHKLCRPNRSSTCRISHCNLQSMRVVLVNGVGAHACASWILLARGTPQDLN
jgi:hypothetical protein